MGLKRGLQAHLTSILLSATGVYQVAAPAGTGLPFVTWQVISRVPSHTHDGTSGVSTIRVQVDIWAGSESQRETLLSELRAGMDGYRGALGSSGVQCGRCFLANVVDGTEPGISGYTAMTDFVMALSGEATHHTGGET
jgi:hypothetical protein